MILIMKRQVLFFDVFLEKDPHLNAVEYKISVILKYMLLKIIFIVEKKESLQKIAVATTKN